MRTVRTGLMSAFVSCQISPYGIVIARPNKVVRITFPFRHHAQTQINSKFELIVVDLFEPKSIGMFARAKKPIQRRERLF